MPDLNIKRAPAVDANQRAWSQVYDDINDIIKSVNRKSTNEGRTRGTDGNDGNVRLFKDNVKSKYFIEGKFKDGWAKRELLFTDNADASQDESINFSSTESYVKPDGSVPFTSTITGVAPSNALHLTTKGYADTGRLISVSKSSNNLIFGMTNTASNITFTGFGSNAYNSTSIPTTFVASLTNEDNTGQAMVADATGSIYRIVGGNNVTVGTEGDGSNTWVEIDCDINTSNFLSSSTPRWASIKTFDTDAFVDTRTAGSGTSLVLDHDNSNVELTLGTVTVSGTQYDAIRLNTSVSDTNTTYTINASTVSGGANFNIAGINPSSTDTIKFESNGATTVSRTNADTIRISSTDNNDNHYINGGSISTAGVLTLTGVGSAGVIVDLAEEFLLASAGGGALTANSIHTLTNKSGNNTQWTNGAGYITGSSSSLLTNKTGAISMWTNDSAYITASSSATLTNKGGNISQWTNNSNFISANQTITLSGDASGSGTTAITVVVANDSHTHNTQYYTQSTIDTTLADYAPITNPLFTSDLKIANSLWINGYADSTANRIRLHHNDSHAYHDWETGNYYIRYDTTTKYMMDSSGNFHADNDVYAYSTSVGSDKKLKKNIKDIKYGLSDILKLRGVDFDWKEKRDGVHDIGVIAQEVRKVIPEVVQEVDDLVEDTYLSVDYAKLVPVLIEAIKELNDKGCKCGVG